MNSTAMRACAPLIGVVATVLALLMPAVALAAPTTESVARRYMQAVAARDLDAQPWAADALFRDRTVEFFDMGDLVAGIEGKDAIVALQRSWNLKKIDFEIKAEFFVGEWAVFSGAATLVHQTQPGSRTMPFLTVLRVQDGEVSERHDYWNYAEGFPASEQQQADAKATARVADRYFKAYLEQRFDAARSLMALSIDFNDPTAAVFGPEAGRTIRGADKLDEKRRATFAGILDFGFDVDTKIIAHRHAIYTGRTYYTMPGTAVGSARESVRFEHPAVFVIAVEDDKVVFHRDYVDYSRLNEQAEAQADQAGDWQSLRGPHFDGSVQAGLDFDRSPALELAWKRSIGSGYSGVTVAGDRVVTAFSDGIQDVIAAWSLARGEEAWRTALGPTYKGHDGSTDGPVATPTLSGDRVYLVGPHGDLVALAADSGKLLWKKNLVATWDAVAPTYGFGTNPLEIDGVLVVAVGTEEHSVVGLDPADGRQLWSHGADRVTYSTPIVLGEGKAKAVVIAGAKDLMALNPKDGMERWTFQHSEQAGYDPTYPQLQPVDGGLLVTFSNEAALYDMKSPGSLTERWRSAAFKGTVAIPVSIGDHLYGFNGTFLTCVSKADGKPVWKSRTPRSRGLIAVDGHLVILGAGGTLTVAKADPAGYQEVASLPVSDHGGYTAPSFAGGRIFVRNRTDLASVAIRSQAASRSSEVAAVTHGSGEFAAWLRRVAATEAPVTRTRIVDQYLAKHSALPIVTPDWVHFVYRGLGEAVSIVGQMNDGEVGDPLERVADTDVFVRSYPAIPGGRWEYRFQADFGAPQADAGNPLQAAGGASEVLFQGFEDPDYVTETAKAHGRLETLTVTSAAYGADVDVSIYLPAAYDPKQRYPLIVMPNGKEWMETGGIVGILDRLFEIQGRPALVALVPMSSWVAGSWGGRAVTLLGEELLPAIQASYPVSESVDERTLWTVEDKAAVGLQLALDQPEAYGRFAFQSPKLYFGELPDLSVLAGKPTAFHVSWSQFEFRSQESGADDGAQAEWLARRVQEVGLRNQGGKFAAGPGYRTWRIEADAILNFLLGE